MSLKKLLGSHIKQLREEKGWTQEDLAAETGIGLRTIQNAEGGKHWPVYKNLEKISRKFGMEPEGLFKRMFEQQKKPAN